MPTFTAETLESFANSLLLAGGASSEEAECVAASLIGANLRGFDSHGVMRIPFYLDRVKTGDIQSGVELAVINETPSSLATDANWGFGQLQATRLTQRLIDKAAETGSAIGTMIHSSHIGRVGQFCEQAADAHMLILIMANTHGVARRVAPPGGTAPRLGTNPLAMGVPFKDGPIILDFSTSVTAEGKVRVKKIAGEPVPEGWLLDSQGRPTTDPNDLYADPPGTILPMGGTQTYKGFGLALMIDIFAGALSGGLCAREVPQTPHGNCVFMMVANPALFGGIEHFDAEVQQVNDFVRGCPRVAGVDQITLPGDPERSICARLSRDGITLDDENWQQLVDLAGKLGVSLP